MAISEQDINLSNFLKIFCMTTFPEAEKTQLPDADFLKIASLLKIDLDIIRMVNK